MSPVETYCRNLDYFIPEEGRTKNLTGEEMTRIRKLNNFLLIIHIMFKVEQD